MRVMVCVGRVVDTDFFFSGKMLMVLVVIGRMSGRYSSQLSRRF